MSVTPARSFPRPLSEREREVLALMAAALPEGHPARTEVATAQAVGGCRCGTCPTIDLTAADETPLRDRTVLLGSHPLGAVLLFVDDGHLSCLELAPEGDEPVLELPPAEEITVLGEV